MICLPDYLEKPVDCHHCWIPCNTNNYNECPTIEIVRCKNCKFFDSGFCDWFDSFINEDDFCSYGTKKEMEINEDS